MNWIHTSGPRQKIYCKFWISVIAYAEHWLPDSSCVGKPVEGSLSVVIWVEAVEVCRSDSDEFKFPLAFFFFLPAFVIATSFYLCFGKKKNILFTH